ncbi:hypothetical protein F4560_000884 [Saccharothrix ecbatanensis]|uniref:Uncharacterized protein n=1 Tax=Saccharothrix ecbatanensis TaxID=1105145 RepID=A0A7W9LYT3_9PSEU|nr:hypothetical protein [Saccharothrix ecbatanensis]MBB5801116.1 hypothetical protein [Saccharothrix ecbatanensis]
MTHESATGIEPGGGSLVLSLALLLWLLGKASMRFVLWFERHDGNHPNPIQEESFVSETRPRPLRVAGSVGGLTALVTGLVGSGLLTTDQGDAITGFITAALVLLGTFGVVISTEHRVTPLVDPRDADGRALTPADDTDTY